MNVQKSASEEFCLPVKPQKDIGLDGESKTELAFRGLLEWTRETDHNGDSLAIPVQLSPGTISADSVHRRNTRERDVLKGKTTTTTTWRGCVSYSSSSSSSKQTMKTVMNDHSGDCRVKSVLDGGTMRNRWNAAE